MMLVVVLVTQVKAVVMGAPQTVRPKALVLIEVA